MSKPKSQQWLDYGGRQDPPDLTGIIEFMVDSPAGPPHACGPIEVQCGPLGIAVRWSGSEEWDRWEWWQLMVLLAARPNLPMQEFLRTLKNVAYEDGYNAGLRGQMQTKQQDEAERRHAERLARTVAFPKKPRVDDQPAPPPPPEKAS